jgi:hypothetical protein
MRVSEAAQVTGLPSAARIHAQSLTLSFKDLGGWAVRLVKLLR